MVKKIDNYLPRCPAENYDSSKKDYFCCLNGGKVCDVRKGELIECQKYREQILPRRSIARLEAMA